MKLQKNVDKELVAEVERQLKETGGYCPCRLTKDKDSKCMCKYFRDAVKEAKANGSTEPVECDCGLWIYA